MGRINMEEIKIGEVFQFGIIKLKCVEAMDASCRGCVLQETIHCRKFVGDCDRYNRSDDKHVIFIEIKE